MIVTYHQPLFPTQYLTLHNDIAQAIMELSIFQQKLLDRAAGLIQGGKCPTVDSITTQCKTIRHRQYMKSIITYTVEQGDKNVPQVAYGIDHTVLNTLSDTYLGKNIIGTDREHWRNDQIILAYRSQCNIEHVLKEMKDRDIGSWWPLYPWTDQKISVHGFSCTIALLLRALAYRRVKEAGIAISMKRLIAELEDIKEVILLSPRKRGTKTAWHHTVLSKTSELQHSLLSILQVNTEETALLG